MKIEIKEINKNLVKILLLMLLVYYWKIDFSFKFLAKRNVINS